MLLLTILSAFSDFCVQAAKTYMEKHYTTFDDCDLPTLVKHCLTSLKETSQNGDINAKNTSVSIVGIGHEFKTFDGEDVQQYIDLMDKDEIAEAPADGGSMQE